MSLKNLSFRHSDVGPKKMKSQKSKSSSDVSQIKNHVLTTSASNLASHAHSPTSTSSSPPDSPIPMEDGEVPVSRRKKMWESFRVRTWVFRKKKCCTDKKYGVVTKEYPQHTEDKAGRKADTESPARHQSTPRSRSQSSSRSDSTKAVSNVSRSSSDGSRSSIRRWRSEIVRQVSMSDSVTDIEAEMMKRGRGGCVSPIRSSNRTSSILVSTTSRDASDRSAAEENLYHHERTRRRTDSSSDTCGETAAASAARNSYSEEDKEAEEDDVEIEKSVMMEGEIEEGGQAEGEVGRRSGKEEEEADSGIALQASETVLRQRQIALMEHPFFLLDVKLHEGVDLVIRDSCGTSDPYVKFKIGGKQVYRSRTIFKNLNPKWDESFTLPIEDITKPLYLKVFDYDRGFHDDPMGNALIDISQFELGKPTELKLDLSERGKTEYMGYLLLTCTLQPKTQEDKDQFLRRTVRVSGDSAGSRKLKLQMWTGVVTIVLVDGKALMSMDDNGLSDPYVKFRMGTEKYRSKVKYKTLNPRWLEQFDLYLYQEQSSQLEITVYDYDAGAKDDFMGRSTVDVSSLEPEVTHRLDLSLEDGAGTLTLLLTISGLWGTDAKSDLANHTPDPRQQEKLMKQYKPFKLSNISDVGHLEVKVLKAINLRGADLGGYSDPFCVLELVNDRRQTHTEYKTLNPEWNKYFEFPVLDIHSVLEVTVFDEDRDKKMKFLGKVAIPLLRIKSRERKWYALKDKKLVHRSKGAILLEMSVLFNHVKAAIRTVNPAEKKLMQVEPKFRIHLMKRNIDRVSHLVAIFVDSGKFLKSCFSWESTARSLTAFIIFLVMVWNFELYMLPITLLIIFLKNLIIAQILGAIKRDPVEGDEYFEEDDDDDDEDKEKEEKKSFKEKLLSIQDVCLQVQEGMDMVASLGERVKNTFNWTVTWLSTLAVVALTVGVIILYHIPLRWLILAWGINKFTKKLRKPNAIDNNELLDFLSRVPSDSELAQYRELRPEMSPTPKKKRS